MRVSAFLSLHRRMTEPIVGTGARAAGDRRRFFDGSLPVRAASTSILGRVHETRYLVGDICNASLYYVANGFNATAAYRAARPEIHKRLMLLATIATLLPAVARLFFAGNVGIAPGCVFRPILNARSGPR
jgi:hypothetical protein